jgi:hypothetical protein
MAETLEMAARLRDAPARSTAMAVITFLGRWLPEKNVSLALARERRSIVPKQLVAIDVFF